MSGADGDIWCRLFLSPGPPASGILFTRWKPLISHSTGIANGGLPAPQALSLFVSPKNPLGRLLNFQTQRHAQMKTPNVENIVVDEVHQRTYVVMARRILTDGEIYSAIRVELLKPV